MNPEQTYCTGDGVRTPPLTWAECERAMASLPPAPNGDPWIRPLDHVIVGGESGPHARPCRVEWIRSVVRQCRAAGVPVFVKQLGSHPVGSWNEAMMLIGEGERYRSHADSLVRWQLKDAKGGDPAEWPEDLRVREIPEGNAQ